MPRSLHQVDIHSTPHATHDAEPVHEPVHAALDDEWREPRNFDAPPPRPGFTQRWIRVEDREGKDGLNLNNKLREGWRPRPLDTIPGLQRDYPVLKHASLGDVVYVGGCVLCEMPIQRAKSRNRVVQNKIERQNLAIQQDAEQASRAGARVGMPPIQRDEQLSVTSRRPHVQGD